jgi:hypothetical protein
VILTPTLSLVLLDEPDCAYVSTFLQPITEENQACSHMDAFMGEALWFEYAPREDILVVKNTFAS